METEPSVGFVEDGRMFFVEDVFLYQSVLCLHHIHSNLDPLNLRLKPEQQQNTAKHPGKLLLAGWVGALIVHWQGRHC